MTNSAWARTCLECGTPLGSLFTRGTSLGGYLAAAWMVNTWQQSVQCKQPKDPAPCEQLGTTWEAFLLTETPLSSTGRAFDPCCQDCARTSTPRAALMATCSGQHHSPSWSYVHTNELLLQPSAHLHQQKSCPGTQRATQTKPQVYQEQDFYPSIDNVLTTKRLYNLQLTSDFSPHITSLRQR